MGNSPERNQEPLMTRRAFLAFAALTALNFACGQTEAQSPSTSTPPTPEPTRTATPEPTSTSIPTATAEAQRTKLPEVISKETVQFVTLPLTEIIRMQEEAARAGEIKLPLPDSFMNAGGRVIQKAYGSKQEVDLLFSLPPGPQVEFPAMISGTITVVGANATSYGVGIAVSNQKEVDILFPRNGTVLVKQGQKVFPNTSVVRISYNPDDSIQKGFEKAGAGVPMGTVVDVAVKDLTTKNFDSLTLDRILRTEDGEIVTVSSTPPGK